MTTPNANQYPTATGSDNGMSPTLRGVMWVAISALIAGALLCVVWVLVSPEGDVIPKAFLTILLLAGFAGVTLLDVRLAPGRSRWVVSASMAAWIVALLCGLTLVWVPADDEFPGAKVGRFILIVGFLQLAVLHQRLLWRAHTRHVTPFTRALVVATTLFVVALLFMALVPLTLPGVFDYPDIYGRIMVALAILAAVGTALVPLVTAMFGPKKPGPERGLLPWPTYRDGRTPLPMLPNGQPDFDAQRTGVPSHGARTFGPPAPPRANPYPQQSQVHAQPYPQQARTHANPYPAPPQAGGPWSPDSPAAQQPASEHPALPQVPPRTDPPSPQHPAPPQ